MRAPDLVREAARALLASRSRLLLTGAGVSVGTLALVLILSLSLGLSTLIDDLVASDEQLRHVVVLPGFGVRPRGNAAPEVTGEMSELKRARLRRAIGKRGFGGPPFLVPTRLIDAETERELASLPGVESTRPFLQERVRVEIEGAEAGASRAALTLGVPAGHPHYPERVIAGRWFERDDEPAVVLHELLLYEMGFTSDEAQAALVGRNVRVSVSTRPNTSPLAGLFGGNAPPTTADGPETHTLELRVAGVLRERFGNEPAAFVDEIWAMQTDVFLPMGIAREMWERRPSREGLRSLLLVARRLEDVPAVEEAASAGGLQVRSVREAVERIRQSLQAATVVAAFLAGIAVFVSALGIVNTMVMSILERTREIGLLKALGATDADVGLLFLAEAAILGLCGGAIGVGLAAGLGMAGDRLGRAKIEEAFLMPFEGTLFRLPWWLVAGGLAFAVTTSLAAAIVPALRAARVDPVRALRHE